MCSGGCNKVPQAGQLKQQVFTVPQFWRLESKIKVSARRCLRGVWMLCSLGSSVRVCDLISGTPVRLHQSTW